MSTIHLKLRQIRRHKNLSQEQLAKMLGVSRQAIIAIEQGESLPSMPVLVALLRALDVPFQQLFTGEAWSPFREIDTEKDIAQDSRLNFFSHSEAVDRIPVLLHETDASILISAELPGVKEEDLTVDLGSQHVVIVAVKKPHDAITQKEYIQEIYHGPLMRIISLPCPIQTQGAQAKFSQGVLHLTLPKESPDIKRRIVFKKEHYGSN